MTAILGLSAFYHDSAATLLVDGQVIAAASEERFSRIKHDASFPRQAIEYCLRQAGIDESELDYVGFYEKPLLKFDRLMETYLSVAPSGFQSFWHSMPNWIAQKLHLRREIRRGLNHRYRRRIVFGQHHESHAASAFFPSPFDRAAILTMDGVGEWSTSTLGIGEGNRIKLQQEQRFPHSLGLLYSAFTYYCGFKVNSGEYKLMGLAPYGEPKYRDLILEKLVHLHDDGSFRLSLDHFTYCRSLRMIGRRFCRLFGHAPRQSEAELTEFYRDVASSVQAVTEEIVLRTVNHLHQLTSHPNLCLAGGVALNCVANGRIVRESPFDQIWIQPAAGDAGGSLGIAWLIWHQLLGNPRVPVKPDAQQGSLLGPEFSEAEIKQTLDHNKATYEHVPCDNERNERVANLLAKGMVVGRFDGRAEFGPRALGNRSILGDPRDSRMQSTMNQKIKFRESFRPFAPAVLREHACKCFQMSPDQDSPYMLVVCRTERDDLPAITHVDGSARVQTIDEQHHPDFAKLLHTFYRQTGCPVLINTSFNVRGEPIVGTPQDAYDCFQKTGMDALVIGSFLLRKTSR